jgi:predicted ATPase
LLVADNFEQVVSGGPWLATVLAACPRVAALVTSRIALRLRGERVFGVDPLSLPSTEGAHDPAALSQSRAVALFVERAKDVRPDFEVTARNGPILAEICRRLDGLPLAIELAAVHSRSLPLRTLLDHLMDSRNLEREGAQDLPERQRTLRNTLDWSYELLNREQQALFCRLGVFAGGCSPESAQAVCDPAGLSSVDAIEALESLVDQSLLRQYGQSEDVARFTMLETVREYALSRLRASGELATVRRQHTAYFLGLAESALRELRGRAQGEWLARLEAEYDNLRVALSEAVDESDADLKMRLVGALWRFWVAHGHLAEGSTHAERVLSTYSSVDDSTRALVLDGAGVLAWHQGDYERARVRLEEGLALSRGTGSQAIAAETLKWLGNTSTMLGHPMEAVDFYEQSCTLYELLGDDAGVIDTRANLGIIYRRTGRYDDALRETLQCLALRERMGNTWGIASSHNNIGEIHRSRGEPTIAIPSYERAVEVWQSLGDLLSAAVGITGLGIAYVESGDIARGLANLIDAEARFKALQSSTYLPELHRYLASAALASGDIDGATREATQSLELAHAAGMLDQAAMTQRTLGQIAVARGELDSAEQLLALSRQTLADAGEIAELARTEALLQSVRLISRGGNATALPTSTNVNASSTPTAADAGQI